MARKCFQVVGQGIPVRMSEADAKRVVEIDKDGEYCPKRLWKEFHDGNADERYRERTFHRLDEKNRIVKL